MIEIERKFLVNSDAFKKEAMSRTYLVQGFLNSEPDRTVRVRIQGDSGVLTVKGRTSEDGTTRFEWETRVPLLEAKALLALCEEGIIEKYRYVIPVSGFLFEVDEFLGANQGLLVAEIELPSADASFQKPSWLGEEVTGDIRYYNAQLSKHPFTTW